MRDSRKPILELVGKNVIGVQNRLTDVAAKFSEVTDPHKLATERIFSFYFNKFSYSFIRILKC